MSKVRAIEEFNRLNGYHILVFPSYVPWATPKQLYSIRCISKHFKRGFNETGKIQ